MAKKRTSKPKKKTTKRKSKKTQKRSIFGFLVKWAFVAGLWGFIFVVGLFAWYAQELPDITKDATFDRKNAIIVKDARGEVIARYGDIVGVQVTTADMPPYLVQAVLAIEDRRFYNHFGIDPFGLARAVVVNLQKGRVAQGGSTITQQLAKNLFLSRERTLKRKIQEAMLAVWLEYELSKDEILSAYLNRVYLGSGTYGVDAASKLYFQKPVADISLRHAATLAGLLKAPSRYSPLRNASLSRQRTEVVLAAMVDAGYISPEQAKGQQGLPPKPKQKPKNSLSERYYTDWIVDELNELIGTPQEDLIVETTLDLRLQGIVSQNVADIIDQYGEERSISEGAMILMRPSGEVIALVGGRNYNASQFNRATQALRPPGSSFKPIVYLAALEQGWKIDDLIDDSPITDWRYRPRNFGGEYYGEVSLEDALTHSLNTAAVRLMKETGPDAVLNAAERLGITSDLERDLSLALGSSGVSLIEMAGAYSTFANGGLAVKPYGITRVTTRETGELYYERPRRKRLIRVFSPVHIQDLTSMMNNVILNGTGQGANFGSPAAGKTGTSQESRDALFMGFTRELVGVVWLGNDDNSPMKKVTGGSFPTHIWREVMRRAEGRYAAINSSDFEPPSTFEHMIGGLFYGGYDRRQNHRSAGSQGRKVGENPDIPESQRYN